MDQKRRKILKVVGLFGLGALLGIPQFAPGEEAAFEDSSNRSNRGPNLRVSGHLGSCTDAHFCLSDKGPLADWRFKRPI